MDEELEQVEYLENESLAAQKALVNVLGEKRIILADIERENFDFSHKFQGRANDKETLRLQIQEVEHLLGQLRFELEAAQADTKRAQLIVEKEDALLSKKAAEEKRTVGLVREDIAEQIKQAEEQFAAAQATQVKQDAIEKNLKA